MQNQKEKITNYAKIKEILETTRGQIGYYLSDHKDEIINLAINGNSDALYICNYFKSFQKILYKEQWLRKHFRLRTGALVVDRVV